MAYYFPLDPIHPEIATVLAQFYVPNTTLVVLISRKFDMIYLQIP